MDDGESVLEAHTDTHTHTRSRIQPYRDRRGESETWRRRRRGVRERRRECLLRGWLSFLVHKPALAETPWAVSDPAPSVRPSPFC